MRAPSARGPPSVPIDGSAPFRRTVHSPFDFQFLRAYVQIMGTDGCCFICLDNEPPPVQAGCACRADTGLAHIGCMVTAAVSQAAHRGVEGVPDVQAEVYGADAERACRCMVLADAQHCRGEH